VRLAGAMRGSAYDVHDYSATVTGGALAAGDDAADVRWVSAADITRLTLTEGLLDTLTAWGVLGC
jgi:8-oxo-dGTP diphosphatase